VAAAFFTERLLDLLAMAVLAALLFTSAAHNQGMILTGTALAVGLLLVLTLVPWSNVSAWLRSGTGLPAKIPGPVRTLLTKIARRWWLARAAESGPVAGRIHTRIFRMGPRGCGPRPAELDVPAAAPDTTTRLNLRGLRCSWEASRSSGGVGARRRS